jgi:hypothetical protein
MGGVLASIVDDRFLLGSCAGDGLGGDMAKGEVAYGGEAMLDERNKAQIRRRCRRLAGSKLWFW